MRMVSKAASCTCVDVHSHGLSQQHGACMQLKCCIRPRTNPPEVCRSGTCPDAAEPTGALAGAPVASAPAPAQPAQNVAATQVGVVSVVPLDHASSQSPLQRSLWHSQADSLPWTMKGLCPSAAARLTGRAPDCPAQFLGHAGHAPDCPAEPALVPLSVCAGVGTWRRHVPVSARMCLTLLLCLCQ